MRRRLLIVAIFLLAGAVVNVAVAWGCAAWFPFETRQRRPHEYAIDYIRRNLSADPDAAEIVDYWRIRRHGALYFSASRQHLDTEDDEPPNFRSWSWPEGMTPEALRPRWLQVRPYCDSVLVHRYVFAWGWPLLSLWCEHEVVDIHSLTPPRIYRVHGGIETSLEPIKLYYGTYARVLPLRPIWPGFAVNAIFYAAILWLLIPGPFALRRLVRRRRGLCPACGYDLRHGEHEACPECGVTA